MYLRDARGYDGVLPHTLRFLQQLVIFRRQ
jgi:hypothetical protein